MEIECISVFPITYSPAPGYRNAGNNGRLGALGRVGNDGYNWSSTVSSTNGVFLKFYSQYLNPSNEGGRGHGFLLRCLSE